MDKESLRAYLNTTLVEVPEAWAGQFTLRRGKIRDIIDLGQALIITTTDRISAFDRVLTTVPCKGQILNELSLFWFGETDDIVPNHILQKISGRSVLTAKCEVLPVEFVVRGYLTGSAWRAYQKGEAISGIRLKSGLKMNQRFPEPLVTPSTKASQGQHDEPISLKEIVAHGLLEEPLLDQIVHLALALFKRGTQIAKAQGLILVDTKYEFGLLAGKPILIDEIHTPDSSRFWYLESYDELFKRGEKQRELDKEYLRQWLMSHNFMGDGEPPVIPDEVRLETALRYLSAYEKITGQAFSPLSPDLAEEQRLITTTIQNYLKHTT